MATRNARIGFCLFALYVLLYGGFVLLNAFLPETMEWTPIAGINLAIVYGFGLIVAALVLALVYGWLCRATGDDIAEIDVAGGGVTGEDNAGDGGQS